jgi:hypothetical protein
LSTCLGCLIIPRLTVAPPNELRIDAAESEKAGRET